MTQPRPATVIRKSPTIALTIGPKRMPRLRTLLSSVAGLAFIAAIVWALLHL